MKNVIIIGLAVFMLSSCHSSDEIVAPSPEAIQKAEAFKRGEQDDKTQNTSYQYVIPETLRDDYDRSITQDVVMILFQYGKTNIPAGVQKFEDLITERGLGLNASQLNAQQIGDLSTITYANLEHLLFKQKQPNPVVVAKNLKRIFKHTNPLETRVLSKALLLAKPALKDGEFTAMSNYIQQLNKDKFNTHSLSMEQRMRLQEESELAVQLLNSSLD